MLIYLIHITCSPYCSLQPTLWLGSLHYILIGFQFFFNDPKSTIYSGFLSFYLMFLLCSRIPSKMLHSFQMSGSSGLGHFLRLSLFSMISKILRRTGQEFSRIYLYWNCSGVFLIKEDPLTKITILITYQRRDLSLSLLTSNRVNVLD